MTVLSLFSYNSTGLSAPRVDYIRDIIKQFGPQLICLQETWHIEGSTNTIDNIHPNYSAFSVSGVDSSQDIIAGRPYGGTAILYNKTMADKVLPVKCANRRISALNLKLCENFSMVICNVYMPTDTYSRTMVNDEYMEVLSDLDSIIQQTDPSALILAGDFNTDFSRNNAQSSVLYNFVKNRDLKSA